MKKPANGTLVRNPPPHELVPDMDPVVARVACLAREMFADPAHQRNAEIQRRRLDRQTVNLRRKYAAQDWLGGRWWRGCKDCHCGRGHKVIVIQSRVSQSSSGLDYKIEEHCPSIFWGRLRLARPDLHIPAEYFLGPTDGWEDVIGGAHVTQIPKGVSFAQEDMHIRRKREEAEAVLSALEEIAPEMAEALRLAQKAAAKEVLRRGRVLLGDVDAFIL